MSAKRLRAPEQVAAIRASRPPRGVHQVTKLTILRRLAAAGLRPAARAAFASNPDAKEEWDAATVIYSNDPQVRGFLNAIGADLDAILAPEGA